MRPASLSRRRVNSKYCALRENKGCVVVCDPLSTFGFSLRPRACEGACEGAAFYSTCEARKGGSSYFLLGANLKNVPLRETSFGAKIHQREGEGKRSDIGPATRHGLGDKSLEMFWSFFPLVTKERALLHVLRGGGGGRDGLRVLAIEHSLYSMPAESF